MFGVSRERIRQIERNAFKKMHKGLYDPDFLVELSALLGGKHDRARILTLLARIQSETKPGPPPHPDEANDIFNDDCEM